MAEDTYRQYEVVDDTSVGIERQQLIANQLAIQQEAEQERVAEEKEAEENEPVPMSWGFFIKVEIVCIIGDLIDFFTAGTLGWLIGLAIDGILFMAVGLSKSGRKQFKRIVVGLLAETIPIIDVLPFRTIFMAWGFIKSRSKIASTADRLVHIRHSQNIAAMKTGADKQHAA